MTETQARNAQEALVAIRSNASMANYEAVYEALMERGIPHEEIAPKENVLTYRAWLALGRQVRKGEKGVKIVTYIRRTKKGADEGDEDATYTVPRTTTVFHVSQTDPAAS